MGSHKPTVATVTTPINMELILILLLLSPYFNYALPTENVQREVHTLNSLISDLQWTQKELRQSSNDHTIVNWLKETVGDLRREMNEWITKDQNVLHQLKESLTSEFGQRMGKEMRQVRLQMRELKVQQARHQAFVEEMKICHHSKYSSHHVKTLTKEVEYLQREMHRLKRQMVSKRNNP